MLPSRSTTTRVASSKISSSLWLTNIRVTPWDWSRRTRSNSFFTSCRERVAVGSSRMSSRAFTATAFTISTTCCSATDRSMTLALGSRRTSSWSRASSSSVRAHMPA